MKVCHSCLLALTVVAVISADCNSTAHAQVILGVDGPYNPSPNAKQPRDPDEPITYRLTVTPAAEPDPTLRYSLYPRAYELEPGNSALKWYRCLTLAEEQGVLNEETRHWHEFITDDPADTPIEELRRFVASLQSPLDEARAAAFRKYADWDLRINELRGRENITFPLAEFQKSRDLARLLLLRARLNMLDGNYDDALADMSVALRFGHDLAEAELAISNLVGMAVHAITMVEVRHLIDAPGSPNLYWALALLPRPLFDTRPAIEMEMQLPERYFPWLFDPESAVRTNEQWRQLFHEAVREFVSFDFPVGLTSDSPDHEVDLVLLALVMRAYPGAKRDLVAGGLEPDDVEAMSVGQVVAVQEARICRQVGQAAVANLMLPYEVSRPRHAALMDRFQDEGYLGLLWRGRSAFGIESALMPALQQFTTAAARRESMHSALMVVEALRMHLAASGGKLPASLGEIQQVPVPKDPITGDAFPYRLDGDTAVLDVPFPRFDQRFEIRVETDRGQ